MRAALAGLGLDPQRLERLCSQVLQEGGGRLGEEVEAMLGPVGEKQRDLSRDIIKPTVGGPVGQAVSWQLAAAGGSVGKAPLPAAALEQPELAPAAPGTVATGMTLQLPTDGCLVLDCHVLYCRVLPAGQGPHEPCLCAVRTGSGRRPGGEGRQPGSTWHCASSAGLPSSLLILQCLISDVCSPAPLPVSTTALQFERMRGYMKQHVGREQGSMFADATGGQWGALAVPWSALPLQHRACCGAPVLTCAGHAVRAGLPFPVERMEGELQGLVAALLTGVQHLAAHMLTRLASHFSVLWCVGYAHRALQLRVAVDSLLPA